jgi:Na+-translocating ferredoxin:NAD+ oxidoreductase subunit A
MQHYFALVIGAIFINNILLAQYLGNCPFLGTSKKMDTAIGMSAAVIFVVALAGAITWTIYKYIMVPTEVVYLRTMIFILVIASLVQFVEMFLKKSIPALYKALGIYLPLITTNCIVLAATFININEKYNFMEALVYSIAMSSGYALALVLFAGVRERFEISRIPGPLQGTGIGLATAGLISLSFFAFKGMI